MSDDDNVVNAFRDAQAADEAKRREIDNQKPERERKPRSLGVVDSPVSLMDAAIRDDDEAPEDDASWIDNPSEVGWRGFLNKFGFSLAPTKEERAVRLAKQKDIDHIKELNAFLQSPARKTANNSPFITVFSEKGGVGKTTTSALLALAFARLGNKHVAICEVNPDRGTLGLKMGTSEQKNVFHMIQAIKKGEFYGDNRRSPKEFMPKTKDFDINVLSGNTNYGTQRYDSSGEDVVHVAQVVAPFWDVTILDNGTSLADKGGGWDKKSPVLGSLAVSRSLVLVASSDSSESEKFINNTLSFLEEKARSAKDYSYRKSWENLRNNVTLVVVDKEQSERRTVRSPEGYPVTGTKGALETYQRFQLGKKVKNTHIIPYDPALAISPIPFNQLRPETLRAVREMAVSAWRNC